MGYVKILTDQYPQAILRHIWETSKNAEFLGLTIPKWYNTWVLKIFFVNIFFKNIFLNPKGGAFGSEKTVFAVQGGNFSKKKILRFWKSLKYV